MDTKEMAERAGQKAQDIKEATQEWTEKAKGTARDAGAAADLYLREYAWTTVALVAVAAAALGFWVGRSRD